MVGDALVFEDFFFVGSILLFGGDEIRNFGKMGGDPKSNKNFIFLQKSVL